jgi:hypothetical protein
MPAIHPTAAAALEKQALNTATPVAAWLRAWHQLAPWCTATTLHDQVAVIQRCEAAADLTVLAGVLRICRADATWLTALLDAVDRHPVASLPQWIQGLALAREWLSTHRPQAGPLFQSLVGYLSCCAELYGSQTLATSFTDTVRQLLQDYGIEGQGEG